MYELSEETNHILPTLDELIAEQMFRVFKRPEDSALLLDRSYLVSSYSVDWKKNIPIGCAASPSAALALGDYDKAFTEIFDGYYGGHLSEVHIDLSNNSLVITRDTGESETIDALRDLPNTMSLWDTILVFGIDQSEKEDSAVEWLRDQHRVIGILNKYPKLHLYSGIDEANSFSYYQPSRLYAVDVQFGLYPDLDNLASEIKSYLEAFTAKKDINGGADANGMHFPEPAGVLDLSDVYFTGGWDENGHPYSDPGMSDYPAPGHLSYYSSYFKTITDALNGIPMGPYRFSPIPAKDSHDSWRIAIDYVEPKEIEE